MILPGLATGLSSVRLSSGRAGASFATARARVATASRFAMKMSCCGSGYAHCGNTSRADVTSRTMRPSTNPSRPSPNLQNLMVVLPGNARRRVPPRRSVFLLELDRSHVGSSQVLHVLENLRHEQIGVPVRLDDRREPFGHRRVRAVRHAIPPVVPGPHACRRHAHGRPGASRGTAFGTGPATAPATSAGEFPRGERESQPGWVTG